MPKRRALRNIKRQVFLIKCISFKELQEGKELHSKCKNYLGSRTEFETDREKIIQFCEYAVRFFENV